MLNRKKYVIYNCISFAFMIINIIFNFIHQNYGFVLVNTLTLIIVVSIFRYTIKKYNKREARKLINKLREE
ncbi:MAG: hypothetical protein ACOCP8_01460 [archaeon]